MRHAGNWFYFLSSLFFVSAAIMYLRSTPGIPWINLIGCLLFFGGATVNLLDRPR